MANRRESNGYKWNSETKTLEKLIVPKFKVGDRIRSVKSSSYYTVVSVEENSFYIKSDTEPFPYKMALKHERNYELASNKFDISTLKPFDKVLIRDIDTREWAASLFSYYSGNGAYKYVCINNGRYAQCIPYEGNEHLLGKMCDCNEYYKTWEE